MFYNGKYSVKFLRYKKICHKASLENIRDFIAGLIRRNKPKVGAIYSVIGNFTFVLIF